MHMKDFINSLFFNRDVTLIIGARCCDGVVMLGDTKTINQNVVYSKKITLPFSNNKVMFGGSGKGGLYNDFLQRVTKEVIEIDRKSHYDVQLTTNAGFQTLVNRVLRDMNEHHRSNIEWFLENLSIMCAMRIDSELPDLLHFLPIGSAEQINEYFPIGSGCNYGKLFFENTWKPNWTIEQTIKLGLLTIKAVNEFNLDNSVGFNEQYPPQVCYIQNNEGNIIVELPSNEINEIMKIHINPKMPILKKWFDSFKY